MRLFCRAATLGIACVFIAGVVLCILARVEEGRLEEGGIVTLSADARSSTAYIVDREEWTVFRIPEGRAQVKLVSNAAVEAEYFLNPGFKASYAIEYQVLDGDDHVVDGRSYVLTAGFTLLGDATGAASPGFYYLGLPLAPLSSRTFLVRLDGLRSRSGHLRLRVGWADGAVREVAARLYHNEEPPAFKLGYLWQRMSTEKRYRLARANVYTVDLLTEEEKRNILLNRWYPLAPVGSEGKDFRVRRLYIADRESLDSQGELIVPRGLHVEAGQLGVIPLPEDGGCVRIEVECLGPSSTPSPGWMTWFARKGGSRRELALELIPGQTVSITQDLAGGMLEIFAPTPFVARAFLLGDPDPVEITPEPECVSGYLLGGTIPVVFESAGVPGEAIPFRLDFRRVEGLPQGGAGTRGSVRCSFLDAEGRALGSLSIEVDEPPTAYDALVGAYRHARVSDPLRRYLVLPDGCRAVQLASRDPGILVTAYTRPDFLPRRVRVPEDYLGMEKPGEEGREWFLLRPKNYIECLRDQREAVLRVQRRPRAGLALEGGCTASSIEPAGRPPAQKLLAPSLESCGDGLARSLLRFKKLYASEERTLNFVARPGAGLLTPRVLCVRESPEPGMILARIDGRGVAELAVAGRFAEFLLPPTAPGPAAVRFEADSASVFFVNSSLGDASPEYVERWAYPLGPSGLRFPIPMEDGPRSLSIRVYTTAGAIDRTTISARVLGLARRAGAYFDTWTFPETSFDLRAPRGESIEAWGSDDASVSEAGSCILSVGEDLEAAGAEVLLELVEGGPCLVQVTHVRSGRAESRGIFLESAELRGDEAIAGGVPDPIAGPPAGRNP